MPGGEPGRGESTIEGARSVVITGIPDNCTAVGVPAKAIPHESPLGPAAKQSND